jgi:hypothetical protein
MVLAAAVDARADQRLSEKVQATLASWLAELPLRKRPVWPPMQVSESAVPRSKCDEGPRKGAYSLPAISEA